MQLAQSPLSWAAANGREAVVRRAGWLSLETPKKRRVEGSWLKQRPHRLLQ